MKTWFITGTSRGFGLQWAIAALDRGDQVAATARNPAALDDLVTKYGDAIVPVKLDVTDREAAFAAVTLAHERFGRLDVVVNNAGYGQFGMVEEISEAEIRAQLETNVLGALWVTQAALPFLREQGGGHIIQVSSIGGVSAFMNTGAYHASKWAHATPLPVYDHTRDTAAQVRAQRFTAPGNPVATRDAILTLVDSDNPPLRLFLGESPLRIAVEDYGSRLATWAQWQQVAAAAQGTQG
jgi:NAD(P)-dependent dehydrogenase (short-subunit alcohol dehydrogenase family)